ncbi:DUF6090 family protein [Winogradskyella sp. A3E31]|uniref:DUF6090 family protein n=1 Tax=Winogradskyella sp. A3E31 TaxID=3349637 RepID=UPI00398A67AB
MIKFFRKIRQRLLSENKFSKYMIYAIGEIILVVIGILIALSINNWNETNKNEQEQIVFLNNLKNDLTNDLKQLDEILKFQKEKLSSVNELKNQLLTNRDFEKIEQLFAKISSSGNDTYFPNTGSYTTSVSSGKIASLNPSSLRIAITNLYERFYFRLIYNGEIYDKRDDEVAFSQGKFFNKLTLKLNSKDVIEDSEFVNLITIVFDDNSTYVQRGDETKSEILNVLKLVDQRLKE